MLTTFPTRYVFSLRERFQVNEPFVSTKAESKILAIKSINISYPHFLVLHYTLLTAKRTSEIRY